MQEVVVVLTLLFLAVILVSVVARVWHPIPVETDGRRPISDAEFLALCRPGTNPAVALKVRRMVADNFGVRYDMIRPSDHFQNDYGVD